MSSGCGSSFAKLFLICLNVIFLLAGVALALVGIYLQFIDRIIDTPFYSDNDMVFDEHVVSNLIYAILGVI